MTLWTLPLGPKRALWKRRPCAAQNPALSRGCIGRVVPTLAVALCTLGLCLLFLDVPPNLSKALKRDEGGVNQRAGGRKE